MSLSNTSVFGNQQELAAQLAELSTAEEVWQTPLISGVALTQPRYLLLATAALTIGGTLGESIANVLGGLGIGLGPTLTDLSEQIEQLQTSVPRSIKPRVII